uniref:uncharacterized protein isoform X2 n=1 Tax=Pristiophorus japonicus TaxID=55135 RepID=UPI00398F7DE5
MSRQEGLTEADTGPPASSSQCPNGVGMDEHELENEDEIKVEAVPSKFNNDDSQENLGSRDATEEDLGEDVCAGEDCVLVVSEDVHGEGEDSVELEGTMTEEGSVSAGSVHLYPSDLNADSENNLIEDGVIDFSSGIDNTEETSKLPDNEDDDHCQIKLLLAQLRLYEQDTVTLESHAELASQSTSDDYSLESSHKFTTDRETDSSTVDNDRQLFGTVNHQDILTEMSHKRLMLSSNQRPRSLSENAMEDLVQHGTELIQASCPDSVSGVNGDVLYNQVTAAFNHTPDRNHKTSRETCSQPRTSTGNEFGQSEEIVEGMLQDQQTPDFCASDDEAIEDYSSPFLVGRPLFEHMVLKKDWKKEGEALSLAVKELKEEVEYISKSFLPDDGAEHTDPVSQGACHIQANVSEHDGEAKKKFSFPAFKEVPGPCESEDLLDGIIFAASYLGSTQLFSDKNPSTNVRMSQAQEAVGRIKAPEGESQPMTAVDLFISTQRIKVLNAETQEALMDHPLQTISYIADIGTTIVFMARRRLPRKSPDQETGSSSAGKREYKMICHVFESEDASLIAQAIGQAFTVAYQQFLNANGINPADLSPTEYNDLLDTEFYNGDLVHFSKSENSKEWLERYIRQRRRQSGAASRRCVERPFKGTAGSPGPSVGGSWEQRRGGAWRGL